MPSEAALENSMPARPEGRKSAFLLANHAQRWADLGLALELLTVQHSLLTMEQTPVIGIKHLTRQLWQIKHRDERV